MASVSLRSIILYDRSPGLPNPQLGRPVNGWDSTVEGSGNCVTTPLYPPGTKIWGYNDGTFNPGSYTMAYLQFAEGSAFAYDVGDVSDGYNICFHYEATEHHPDGNNAGTWYVVTSDLTNSDGTRGGFAAFPVCDLSGADPTTTGAEFGWFWIEGVCPCQTSGAYPDATRLGGEILTNGDIVAGNDVYVEGDLSNASLAPFCMTSLFEVTLGYDATTWSAPIGYSIATDA